MRFIILGFLLMGMACTSEPKKQTTSERIESIPSLTPTLIKSVSQIDDFYFGYLGLNSITTVDESILLPVFHPASIIKTDKSLTTVITETIKGRGPGEVQDVGVPSYFEERVVVYDQMQDRYSVFDTDLNLIREAFPPKGNYSMYEVYASTDSINLVFTKGRAYGNREINSTNLFLYNFDTEKLEHSLGIIGRLQAPIGKSINGRFGSWIYLPFGVKQLISESETAGRLWLFDTQTTEIAEVNQSFDTLRTITVELPTEDVTTEEVDEFIKHEDGENNYLDVESEERIRNAFPKTKAVADKMIVKNQQIWLKSNLSGPTQLWFVLNMEGEIEYKVHLPNNGMVTHVSDDHIGVRIDDSTFGLFTNPLIK
ncbi:hypothetical protein [Balneola vulgaris]|uniref:hypothetical protein n=1 Tax=Balneola vulgaris TaxID=287535 RepID=UPI0012FCAB5C|nr:hypothetical protein [Balneola vulgaris]